MKGSLGAKKIAFVGADPETQKLANPGGQVTASKGIIEALVAEGFELKVFDTTQASFPIPPIRERLLRGVLRLLSFLRYVMFNRVEGAFIFAGSGFSFYERIAMCWVAKCFGVKTFFFMRDGHFQTEMNSNEKKRLRVQRLVNIPSYICVQGESWKEFFQCLGVHSNRILITRNWLSSDFVNEKVEDKPSPNKVTFCYVGWLVKEKGIEELLSAAKELNSQGLDFTLNVVGSGDLETHVEKFTKENELLENVKLLGWKSKKEVKQIYSESDVFVLPSYAEGFPNSLLEAMSMGLPSIATDVGGIADSLKNGVNGYLIAPRSDSELWQAMKEYLIDESKVELHGSNAIKTVEAMHSKAKNINQLLKKLEGSN